MKFGHIAEKWMVDILRKAGYEVLETNRNGDAIRIDFWVRLNRGWIPVQFTVNKKAILTWKGTDALKCRIVPAWEKDSRLEEAVNGNGQIEKEIVEGFWNRLRKVVGKYPRCERNRIPTLVRTQLDR